jgi:hypothetical protein
LHSPNEFGAAGTHARDYPVEVLDGEHDAAETQCVDRGVAWAEADGLGGVELVEFDAAVSVGWAEHGDGGADMLEADECADVGALDGDLALECESEFDEEGFDGFDVVDDEEDVVHPFEGHVGVPFLRLLVTR